MEREKEDVVDNSFLRFLKNAEGLVAAIVLAVLLWTGNTAYNNSITLAQITTQLEYLLVSWETERNVSAKAVERVNTHLDTIWPRLREMKERIQVLEGTHKENARAQEPWRY